MRTKRGRKRAHVCALSFSLSLWLIHVSARAARRETRERARVQKAHGTVDCCSAIFFWKIWKNKIDIVYTKPDLYLMNTVDTVQMLHYSNLYTNVWLSFCATEGYTSKKAREQSMIPSCRGRKKEPKKRGGFESFSVHDTLLCPKHAETWETFKSFPFLHINFSIKGMH